MKRRSCFFVCIVLLSVFGVIHAGNAQGGSVIVPNVEGIAQDVAAQIIRTAGLQPLLQSASNMSALVTGQDPRPGLSVAAGSEVLLTTGEEVIDGPRTAPTMPAPPAQPEQQIVTRAGEVTITPAAPSAQQPAPPAQHVVTAAASTTLAVSEFRIFARPIQAPVTPNFLVDAKAKRYPPWYPKAFLSAGAARKIGQQTTIQATGATNQIAVFSHIPARQSGMENVTPPWHEGWYYPQRWTKRGRTASSQVVSATPSRTPSIQSADVHVTQKITGRVLVPRVLRLHEADAAYAIKKAGLKVGTITRVSHPQLKAGIVVEQAPQGKAFVEAGTAVHVWVTE